MDGTLLALPRLRSRYTIACWRQNKRKWLIESENLITNEGKDNLLAKYFAGSGYSAAWYIGLIDADGFAAISASDTAAQIGGSNKWKEFTGYSGGVRPQFVPGPVSAQTLDNSASPASYSVTVLSASLYGAFLSTAPSGTSGIIHGETAFAGLSPGISLGDTLTVTITLIAA
jgi:hypothetical protein